MLEMSKIHTAEVLLSESDYDNLKSYFAKKGAISSFTDFGSFDDGSKVKLQIEPSDFSSYVTAIATLYKDGEEVGRNSYEFKKISELNGIFSFELMFPRRKYIFRIRKDWPVSKEALMNRFNIAKWNSFKVDYMENILQYNDWSNEVDLFEVAFTSLIGLAFSKDGSKKDELTKYILNKLEYYGYAYGEVEYIDEINSNEDVINNLIYYLLNQLNKTGSIHSSKEAEGLAYQHLDEFLNEYIL